jgi:hypothetical protein
MTVSLDDNLERIAVIHLGVPSFAIAPQIMIDAATT